MVLTNLSLLPGAVPLGVRTLMKGVPGTLVSLAGVRCVVQAGSHFFKLHDQSIYIHVLYLQRRNQGWYDVLQICLEVWR